MALDDRVLLLNQTYEPMRRLRIYHYAEARAEWRKYLFMDMHDDRDVMDRVRREQRNA